VVRLLDSDAYIVTVSDAAEETGLDPETVNRALNALSRPYVTEYRKLATGGVTDSWYVTEVTPGARRVVGQWPTAESLVSRLAEAFGEAAEEETDPEREGRLRQIATFLGEMGKDVAAEIVAKILLHQVGMG
jgi:hypothetical protein